MASASAAASAAAPAHHPPLHAADYVSPSDIMLGFHQLSLISLNPTKTLFSDVSGFVKKGGVTAIIGPSSSGKTVLMKALSNRAHDVHMSGKVYMNGSPLSTRHLSRHVVFEDDLLIGDLTVRETLETSIMLRRNIDHKECEEEVIKVLKDLGIDHVADTIIGTVLKRGVSGGQKRRTSLGVELVACPSILFLDEPTSGLDSATALAVIQYIRSLAVNSNGKLGVILTIQQPNAHILSCFDHVLLLGRGGMTFFGTLAEAKDYFTSISLPPPDAETPTDFYLRVTDSNVISVKGKNFNFAAQFNMSRYRSQLDKALLDMANVDPEESDEPLFATSRTRQFVTLLKRNFTVAYRDPTLYYLQLFLHAFYGFLVGATFFNLPEYVIGSRINDLFSGVVWLIFLQAYMQVFKVHYLMLSNSRYHHEHSNHSYHVLPYWAAELVSTLVCSTIFLPGVTIAFFMMGMPAAAYPFTLLALYFAAVTSEGLVHLVSQFTRINAFAVVVAQSFLIILCVFTVGSLIRESEVPPYWIWLQEFSFFNHAGRAIALSVFAHVDYLCQGNVDTVGATCSLPSQSYVWPCSAAFDAGTSFCKVRGSDVLAVYKNLAVTDKWISFLYLIILFIFMRLAVLFMYYFPLEYWTGKLHRLFSSSLATVVLETHVQAQRLGGEVHQLTSELQRASPTHQAASKIQRYWRHMRIRERFRAAVRAVLNGATVGALPSMTASNADGSAAPPSSLLAWRDLTLTLPNGKVLIDHVDGFATGGHVLALMGPSGAGKTTMLNALAARATYARVTGAVEFNGRPLTHNDLSFVPQFDDLSENFTVYETLLYAGRLKSTSSERDLLKRLNRLIGILGLKDQADLKTTSLTSGQRKRVSIGIGLIGEPKVLFLDEPTTGLDSSAAFSIVDYITRVAKATNVVCVMTIHQPSGAVFSSLDDLYLLELGRLAYFGKLTGAVEYFASLHFVCDAGCNPADYYLDLITKKPIEVARAIHEAADAEAAAFARQEAAAATRSSSIRHNNNQPMQRRKSMPHVLEKTTWKDLYLASPYRVDMSGVRMPSRAPASEHVSERVRLGVLLERELAFTARNPIYYLRTMQLVAIGLYLGTLYLRLDTSVDSLLELSGASFFNIWVVLFSVTASAPTFARVRRQVQQEFVNGTYKLSTYCLAQFVASIPATLLTALCYQVVFHWLVGFNDKFEAFVFSVLMSFALLMLMEAITLSVVEGLKDAMLSVTFSMILMGMLFLFAGYFIRIDDMPPAVRWITWLIPSKYALEGCLDNVFAGQDYSLTGTSSVVSGDSILESVFGHDSKTQNKWINLLIVFLWMLLYRIVHWCLALFTNRHFGVSGALAFSAGGASAGSAETTPAAATASTPTNNNGNLQQVGDSSFTDGQVPMKVLAVGEPAPKDRPQTPQSNNTSMEVKPIVALTVV
eukprot:m.145601 g.145601  ORF g.145601 m.145601 type:complete len:1425 (-) comp16788_c0_seq2:22-4296(-)